MRRYVTKCLNDIKQAFEQMQANRERGVRFSLSDFPSYTTMLSASQLRHLIESNAEIRNYLRSAEDQFLNDEEFGGLMKGIRKKA